MKSRFLLAALALIGAVAGVNSAAAQSIAYAVPYGTTNMRAGPGLQYQVIAIIRGGSAVNVYGCLADFSWCDSSVENVRGWVSTTRLEFQYGGNLVPIPRYYSYFDAPIIGFDFGYWDRYYRDRPFYRDRPHHRDRDRHSRRRSEGSDVGIFPEEGGGRHPRDQGPPPDFSDQDNQVIEIPNDQGGGRQRHRPPSSQNDVGVFPEEGGAPPRHRQPENRAGRGSQSGDAAPPCPANNPSCR